MASLLFILLDLYFEVAIRMVSFILKENVQTEILEEVKQKSTSKIDACSILLFSAFWRSFYIYL